MAKQKSAEDEKKRISAIVRKLKKEYPDADCELNYSSPLELLVATILSAQCTDVRVNEVTRDLFKKYKAASDYAEADPEALQEDIRSTGFFRQKTKSLMNACADLVEKHGGKVPDTMEELSSLHGVGRKTANVVLSNAFGQPAITVDTHVKRLSQRLGLTENSDPDKIEQDVMDKVPKKSWSKFSHALIFHGRRVCAARKPKCAECVVYDECPYDQKTA